MAVARVLREAVAEGEIEHVPGAQPGAFPEVAARLTRAARCPIVPRSATGGGRRVRVLMVVPRFGPAIVGGAETLVRGLALNAGDVAGTVEVATTCAVDHQTWANVLPPGETEVDGILVRRFPVAQRDRRRHARLHGRLMGGGALSYLEQQELMATSVWSDGLQRFLDREGGGYDLVIAAPYLFGVSFWAAQAWPERTVFIPCLHDEPYAHLDVVRTVVGSVRGCIFNSPGEERLARRLFRVREGGVVGAGLTPPQEPPARRFAEPRRLGAYVLYAGRIEEGKRVDVAADYVARYRRERRSELRLVMIGAGSWRPAPRRADAVEVVGYVDEEDRRAAYAEAVALVNPSELESLSLVLLEAWQEGTPALVAAGSEVMREHCRRSGGGIPFGSYEQFAAALDRLQADPGAARAMGEAGREYVLREYSWPAVRERFAEVLGRLARTAQGAR